MAKYNPSAYADSYTILQKILHVEQWLKDNPQLKVGKSSLNDDGADPVIEIPKSMVTSPNDLSIGDIILVNRVTEQGIIEYVELFQIAATDATKFYGAVIGTLMRGPQGATGPQGPEGPQGPKGDKGDTGADGSSIAIKPDAASCVSLGDGYIDANGHFQVLTSLSPRTFTDAGQIQGPAGPQGETGPAGPQGETGATGATGAAATVAVGTVTTGAAGTQASVTNVGTPTAAVLDFVIPQGQPGASGAGVTSLGGVTGAITLEPPLDISNNRLNIALGEGITANNGLSTVQGSIMLSGTSGTITPSDTSTYIALTLAFEQKADINIGDIRYRFVGLVNGSYHYIAVAQNTAAASRNQIDGFYFTPSNDTISYQRYITIIPEPTSAQTGKILTASGAGVYALADAPTPSGVSYLTTAPSANNPDGDLKFVVLTSEPATKYSGYLYIITGA